MLWSTAITHLRLWEAFETIFSPVSYIWSNKSQVVKIEDDSVVVTNFYRAMKLLIDFTIQSRFDGDICSQSIYLETEEREKIKSAPKLSDRISSFLSYDSWISSLNQVIEKMNNSENSKNSPVLQLIKMSYWPPISYLL